MTTHVTESACGSTSPETLAKRPCLLLVDDTPANIDILIALLKSDYDLKIANRGEKALKICEGPEPIDLILLDVMMPGMDGFEVCRILRERPATREIPILFLTAKTEVDDIVQGFKAGGNDYLAKPFRSQELLARVKTHLTLRAQKLEISQANTELKELLHIMCHDMANHFTVLGACLQLAEMSSRMDINPYLPQLRAAVRQGIDLTAMVREMRRSEEKAQKLSAVPLKPVLEECILLLQTRFEAKNLRVTLESGDVSALAVPCALANSVFNNILTNAIKFSHPGGSIDIRVTPQGDMVCVSIRDHGVGMPPSVLETMFDMGRSHSRPGTNGERGTGFGMPLMRRFVTMFGGNVEVLTREADASPQDSGTEFKIWLKSAEGEIP